jgi:hypothetical protein
MHRTVRDFLDSPRTWNFLNSSTDGSGFVVHVSLLRSILLHKRLVPQKYIGPDLFTTARQTLQYAKELSTTINDMDHTPLLNTLNVALNMEYNDKNKTKHGPPHWSGLVDHEDSKLWPDSFISAAVQYCLFPYVKDQLERRKIALMEKKGRPLLDTATCVRGCNLAVPVSQKREMVLLLLQAGANPNQRFNNATVWQNFLISATTKEFIKDDLLLLLDILEKLVVYGASFAWAMRIYQDQMTWRRLIRSLWGNIAPERTEQVILALQSSRVPAQHHIAPNTPEHSSSLPISPPLTPQSLPTNEDVSPSNRGPSKNEDDKGICLASAVATGTTSPSTNTADRDRPKLKREYSITRRIRKWIESKH